MLALRLAALAAVRLPPNVARSAVMVRTSSLACKAVLPPHLEDLTEDLASGEANLFDVREPQETDAGHLEQALLVPLSALQEGLEPGHDKTKLTYLHCAAGVRVHYAAPILEAMGYERVVPLQEGFATLANLGFPLK